MGSVGEKETTVEEMAETAYSRFSPEIQEIMSSAIHKTPEDLIRNIWFKRLLNVQQQRLNKKEKQQINNKKKVPKRHNFVGKWKQIFGTRLSWAIQECFFPWEAKLLSAVIYVIRVAGINRHSLLQSCFYRPKRLVQIHLFEKLTSEN